MVPTSGSPATIEYGIFGIPNVILEAQAARVPVLRAPVALRAVPVPVLRALVALRAVPAPQVPVETVPLRA